MALTHLQRLEAETIQIMREVVAETEKPVMLYSIGKDSAVMLHIARKAFYPAAPPFPLLHVDTTWKFKEMYRHARPHGARVGDGPHRPRQSGGAREGDQPVHARLGRSHRRLEDAGAQAGARQVWVRCRVRRRPARRGEIARQGARVLVPQRAAPLGSEEPAPGAVAPLQHAQAQGRIDPRLPAVELDRARRVAIHLPGEDSDRSALLQPGAARWSSATARSSWWTTTGCRCGRAKSR